MMAFNSATYDSRPDTRNHIIRVQKYMDIAIEDLIHRRALHDLSKLREPELTIIAGVREELLQEPFGSPRYKELKKTAWAEHYSKNDHHIEHWGSIEKMPLPAIQEMLCDWKAAVESHQQGDNIRDSLRIISEEHNFPPAITQMLLNTIEYFGW